MPRVTVPLVTNYENITRPVAMSIARDVKRLLNISDDAPLYLRGEFESVNQPGGELGKGDEVRFESFQRIVVVADDKIRHSSLLSTLVRQNEEPPVLEDRRLGISLRPVYLKSDLSLSFKYTAASRQQAIKWRDEFSIRRAENRSSIQHEVSYDLPIQSGILELLAHIHDLREKTAGYGETYVDYFKSLAQKPISTIGAVDGDPGKLLVVVPEKQVQAQGWFDFDEVPQETKTDGNSTWEVSFTYNVMYARCTHWYVVYPLVIHQSHIASKWYSKKTFFSVEEVSKNGPIGITALDTLDKDVGSLPPPADGVRFPGYDEWIPGYRNQPIRSLPAMTWMIRLDPKDSQDIISLRQLPGITLTKEMDDYFVQCYDKLCVRGGASCLFTLYCEDLPMSEDTIMFDKDLNMRATRPLDLRRAYHVRLSFPVYYPQFSKAAVYLMSDHAIATLQVFQSILPTLDVEEALTRLLDDNSLPLPYIVWFYKYLQDHGIGFQDGDGVAGPWGGNGMGGKGNANLPGSNGGYGNGSGSGNGPGSGSGNGGNTPGGTGGGGKGGTDGKGNGNGLNSIEGSAYQRTGMRDGRYIQYLAIVAKR